MDRKEGKKNNQKYIIFISMRRVMRITFRRAQAKWKLWYPTSEQNDLRQTYCVCWNQSFFLSFVLSLALCVACKRSAQQRHMFCSSLCSQRCKTVSGKKKTSTAQQFIYRYRFFSRHMNHKRLNLHSNIQFVNFGIWFLFAVLLRFCMLEAAKVATRSKPKRDDFQYTHKRRL